MATVLEEVIQTAIRLRDRIAVSDAVAGEGRRTLTYGTLLVRAHRAARWLVAHGVGPEKTVGIYLPRGADLVTAELAVMLAGGAFVPLDPDLPRERTGLVFEDAAVSCVLTKRSLAPNVPGGIEAVRMASFRSASAGEAEVERPRSTNTDALVMAQRVEASSLAYVIYTSGSTGRPKGVMVEHGALGNFARWHRRELGIEETSRTTLVYSPGFDSSLAEIWPALLAGATICVPPPDVRTSPDDLAWWLAHERITFTDLPTPLVERLLGIPWPATSVLAKMATGGDRLHGRPRPDHPFELWNEYGPTEATVTATSGRVEPLSSSRTELPPIGRPIDGASIYVLDPNLAPVAPGVEGDLYIGGEGVARGYLNQPKLTRERFLADPFAGKPGARMYATGDRARVGAGGELHFCGRADDQVKIRGHRIEPAEIVVALCSHPHVAAAHVALYGGSGESRLSAYWVPRDLRFVPSPVELRRHLAERVPEYMIPATFIVMDQLPLTWSGKVDARALPRPVVDRSGMSSPYVAPADDVELALATIWSRTLRFDPVGVHDDLFELGGQSLIVAQIRKDIAAELGVDVSLAEIMEDRRIAPLAKRIASKKREASVAADRVLPRLVRSSAAGTPAPLTVQQHQVWFFQKLAPSSISYQAQTTIRVFGPLDLAILEHAMTEVTRRHEILRTTYAEVDGEPRQIVQPNVPAVFPVIDLTDVSEEDREDEREAIVARELQRPLSLFELPLARWTAVRLRPEEHELILVEHHVVHDGESFGLLMHELETLYNAFASGGDASVLPELPVQYADFARWQREVLDGPAMRAQLEFWRERLHGAPTTLPLPTDRPRPRMQSFGGDLVRIEMPPSLPEVLRALSRREGVTLFTILMSTFATLIHRTTGESDFCIGSAVANRGVPQTERVIGMFVNTVVLRCDLDGDRPGEDLSFRALLHRVARIVAEASASEAYPFPKLVEALGLPRDMSRNPLFQVMFSFHDSVVPHPRFGEASSTVFERGNGSSKVDLDVVVIPHAQRHLGDQARGDDRITMLWEYNSDLFERVTIARMAGQFLHLLASAVAEPDAPVSRLPLVADDDLARLVSELARGPSRPRPTRAVALDVVERAIARPHAAAVSDVLPNGEHGELRYGELVRRAYRVARALGDRGFGPERTVGICLPRGTDLITAELGVSLAGAAFVPLDPEYPPDRLAVILKDAGATSVITKRSYAERLPAGLELLRGASFRAARERPDPGDAELFADAREMARRIAPSALAYVIYTSGSTGRPKGVMVEHASLASFTAWHREEFHLDDRSRTTLVYSPGFDSSLAEIWPALTAGATLCVAPADVRLSAEKLVAWLVAEKVTFADLPTPLVERVLSVPWPMGSSLRSIATGGDRLHGRPRPEHPWKLFNEYGPTEATVTATSGWVAPHSPDHREPPLPSIGRPIAGSAAYVLDERLAPVPIGVEGEVYLGGHGVARGYLNQPELTRDKFLADPFSADPDARMYRTGDRARWQGDGTLAFCGRADDQVKIRGHRIEPAEVAAALCMHPLIGAAHVVAAKAPSGELGLVAYVARPSGFAALGIDDIRRFLEAHLPTFMLPSVYVMLDALPITSRGKVDSRALPPPVWGNPRPTGTRTQRARTETERRVEAVWLETLKVSEVGVDDNFFDVGGNSLLLGAVHQGIERALSRTFPLLTLFEHPTIRSSAMHLDGVTQPISFTSPSERRIQPAPVRRQGGNALLRQRLRNMADGEGGTDS